MKTSAFLIFASIILVFTYMVTVRIPLEEEGEVTKIVPKSVLLYLEQKNAPEALRRFAASPFGQRLQSIDFAGVAVESGVSDDYMHFMKNFSHLFGVIKDDPVLRKVLGRKMAVALMQPIDSSPEPDVMEFLQDNTVIVAQPENLDIVADVAKNTTPGRIPVLSSSQYGVHRIHRILLGEHPFSLVFLKKWVVLSQNEKHIRNCIDTFDGEMAALATDPDFQAIRHKSTDPESFFFAPLKTVRQFMSALAEGSAFPGKDLLMKELQSTAGFNGFGYVAWSKEKKYQKRMLIRYDKEELSPFAMKYVSTPPVQSSMLSLATKDPMVYYWSNTLKFKNLAMYIEDVAQHDPRLAEFLNRLKASSEKDVPSIFALFDKEASIIVEQGPQDVLFPFPLGIFFVRVEKVDEFKEIVERLVQTYNLPLKEEQYGSAWFRYWSRGPQDGLLPLYGFWQDLFFVGNSTRLLRKIIDANKSRATLADIAAARRIDPGVSERNNSVTYLNNVQLLTTAKNFLEVLGTFVAIEDREVAMKIRLVLKKVVNPLLEAATIYSASASRSYITDDMLTIDSITDVSEHPTSFKD